MDARHTIRELRKDPERYLEHRCPRCLDTFLVGYAYMDESMGRARNVGAEEFEGPAAMGMGGRAYLMFDRPEEAMMHMLDAVERALAEGPASTDPGPLEALTFYSLIAEPVDQGRSAMVLGEATVSCLYHCYQGFLAGTESIAPEEAAKQQRMLHEFEAWLQEKYEHPRAKWQRILRVYEGECAYGVKKFVELWRAFERTRGGGSQERAT